MPKRVIIDTDPGIDDALALVLALQSPELRVEAITTVSGNVHVDLATRNALMVLDLFPPERRPPVARGADRPLTRALHTAAHVHGEDGLGELWRYRMTDGKPRYQTDCRGSSRTAPTPVGVDAVTCLLDLIRGSPGALTLITLGPLTNIAHALQRDAAVMRQLAGIVMMGGAVTVPGNITPTAEFNIYVDPEAAQRVFASDLPLTLIGLDVTERVRLTAEMIDQHVHSMGTRLSQFIVDCTAQAIQFSTCMERPPGMAMHDPLAVGAVIDPSLVCTVPLAVQVETQGALTVGMTIADRRPLLPDLKGPANVDVALAVDAPRFLELFLTRIRTP